MGNKLFTEILENAPANEPERQFYFIEQIKALLDVKKGEGYEAKAMVTVIGCQMSAKDGEKLQGILQEAGYSITEKEEEADVILFTTCTVRENANQKLYGRIGQLKHLYQRNKDLIIGITGCMMQEKDEVETIQKKYPYVHLIFGTHNIYKLAELLLEALISKERKVETWEDTSLIVENLPSKRKYPFRASVNISFGCNNFCTYCIVPYVRGRERSRRPEDIVKEVQCLADAGVIEIMLLGQNVNSYGKGLVSESGEDITFAGLLRMIEKVDKIKRIRFMTPHPKDFSDELIEVIADSKKICRHIHLPFQAGSNNVLKRMNRRYTKESYLELADRIKKRIPEIALTTDIIVGFPGETEEDFEDTLDVVRQVRYQSAYMFEYSKRTGTPAAAMEDQVDVEAVKSRFKRLQDTVAEYSDDKLGSRVGQMVEVLAEEVNSESPLVITGRMSDNTLVHFSVPTDNKDDYIGKLLDVKITENCRFYLMGEL